MPMIHVYLREQGTTPEFRKAIASSIQRAMIDTFGLPEDDYFQVTHETKPENMSFDRHYFGIERGENAVMIQLAFNQRPPEAKKALFDAIVKNLQRAPGLRQEDIYMNILEAAPENWWAYARTVDPETGTDSRMKRDPNQLSSKA